MQVEVNETNIDQFGLVQLTGNTREELLVRADEAATHGFVLSVTVPDDQLIEQNVFDYAQKVKPEDLPKPPCVYTLEKDRDGNRVALCVVHNSITKYSIDDISQIPGLQCDVAEAANES